MKCVWKDDIQATSPIEPVPDILCFLMQLEQIERAEIIGILNVSPIDDMKICHLAQVKMAVGTITH